MHRTVQPHTIARWFVAALGGAMIAGAAAWSCVRDDRAPSLLLGLGGAAMLAVGVGLATLRVRRHGLPVED